MDQLLGYRVAETITIIVGLVSPPTKKHSVAVADDPMDVRSQSDNLIQLSASNSNGHILLVLKF